MIDETLKWVSTIQQKMYRIELYSDCYLTRSEFKGLKVSYVTSDDDTDDTSKYLYNNILVHFFLFLNFTSNIHIISETSVICDTPFHVHNLQLQYEL